MQSPENIGKMFLGKYLPVTTSGTTSRPALLLLDENAPLPSLTALGVKRLDISKEALRKALKTGAAPLASNPPAGFIPSNCLIRLRGSCAIPPIRAVPHRPRRPSSWEQAAMLNRYKPSNISAHPSLLWRLDQRLPGHPVLLARHESPVGKPCSPQRQAIEAAFPAPAAVHYVSAEGGLIATQCATGNYHLNSDCVILEPVNRDLTPPRPGTLLGVLVTNLSNFIQPVIRYLLEDRVRFLP